MSDRTIALFCGSRNWEDRQAIWQDIQALPDDAIVIAGASGNVDTAAAMLARLRGLHVAEVPALWGWYREQGHAKAAGPRRNHAMLALGPTCGYAYNLGTPGTTHMVGLMTRAGIPVFVRDGRAAA